MKATKIGNKYQITYRCPNYTKLVNERFDTLEEAELRIAQINLERKRGTLTPPAHLLDPDNNHALFKETVTIRQLMEEYVNLYGLNHWSESTLSCNQHRINDYILPYIGDIPIKTLTTHRLELYYQKLLSMPAVKMKGREQETNTISISVVEKVHAILRSALNQAVRWDYLQGVNPAMAVELPRQKHQQRAAWDDQEARHALQVCTDPLLRLCMYLALGCSMRIGEILGLTWDCVHMEDKLVQADSAYLTVEKELRRCDKSSVEKLRAKGRCDIFFTFPPLKQTESSTLLVLKTPKTESSVRDIYIPSTVVDALKQAQRQQSELKASLGPEYEDFNLVIAQENGRPVEERIIAKSLKVLIHANELRPVVFHSLRHSSTSLKLRISGGDIKAVQGDTGHAQSNMVTDVYSHIMNDDRKRLARQMDDQFFSATPQAEKSSPSPAKTDSMAKAVQLLQSSPEMADSFLQMAQIFANKS